MERNNTELPETINLDTFYLTGLLLNYNVGGKIIPKSELISPEQRVKLILEKILEMIVNDRKYPKELLISKFFEYALWKKISFDELFELVESKLVKSNLSEKTNYTMEEDSINKFSEYLNFISKKDIRFIPFVHQEVYSKIKKILSNRAVKLGIETEHKGQPLPDPELGRPKLSWGYCQYSSCREHFSNPTELVNHLVTNNVYTQGFHLSHEESVEYNGLTPNQVILKNITKCPSWVCNTKTFDSPQSLIEHLKILGIKPFWQKGMVITPEIEKINLINETKKIFTSNSCTLCLDKTNEIIINRCGHQVYCVDCLNSANKFICPICRGNVDYFYPYA